MQPNCIVHGTSVGLRQVLLPHSLESCRLVASDGVIIIGELSLASVGISVFFFVGCFPSEMKEEANIVSRASCILCSMHSLVWYLIQSTFRVHVALYSLHCNCEVHTWKQCFCSLFHPLSLVTISPLVYL